MFRIVPVIAAALTLLLLPVPELAAQGACAECDLPPGCRGNGNKKKLDQPQCQRLTLTVYSDINFGRLVVVGDGVGQVIIDLSSGSKIVSGGLDDLGGWAVRGTATVTGAPNQPLLIGFPSTIVMTDADGSSAELRDFATDIQGGAVLDGNGQLEFNFSGTLFTDGDVANGGILRGRVPITVSYP